ncbi:MAG: hypothetical protein J7M26_09940, partial [Armatimonadetes bacterium]|nr:hypothetical protein [Armatimonadota bacterium]
MSFTHRTVLASALLAMYVLALAPPPAAGAELVHQRVGGLDVALDTDLGAVVSLRSLADGQEWAAEQAAPLWRVWLRTDKPGETSAASPQALGMTCHADVPRKGELRLVWTGGDSGLHVEVRLRETAEGLEGHLSLRKPRELAVTAVSFPALALVPPLPSKDSDQFILPSYDGSLLPAGRGRLSKPGGGVSFHQPGSWSMQWVARSQGTGGIMLQTFDTAGYPKACSIQRSQQGLLLQILHYFSLEPTERLEVPYPVLLRGFKGGWSAAADLYRPWALRQAWCASKLAERKDRPEALRRAGAMVMFTWRPRQREPHTVPDVVEGVLKRWDKLGAGPLLVHTRGWEKHGTWVGQDYLPPYPDAQTFRRLSALARWHGSEHFIFLSGYVWTRTFGKKDDGSFAYDSRDYFDRIVKPHAVLNPDGKPFISKAFWLQGGENAVLCPADPWVQDLLCQVAKGLRSLGVRLMQMDQVVGGGLRPCYSTRHGHPPGPGLWQHQALVRQLKRLLDEGHADGEFGLSLEEPNELYLPYLSFYHARDHELVGWPIPPGARPAPLFAYVYHEYARGYSGWLTHGIGGFWGVNYGKALRYTTALAIVNGKLLGGTPDLSAGTSAVAGESALYAAGARVA